MNTDPIQITFAAKATARTNALWNDPGYRARVIEGKRLARSKKVSRQSIQKEEFRQGLGHGLSHGMDKFGMSWCEVLHGHPEDGESCIELSLQVNKRTDELLRLCAKEHGLSVEEVAESFLKSVLKLGDDYERDRKRFLGNRAAGVQDPT